MVKSKNDGSKKYSIKGAGIGMSKPYKMQENRIGLQKNRRFTKPHRLEIAQKFTWKAPKQHILKTDFIESP
jgi:hypothetical protein